MHQLGVGSRGDGHAGRLCRRHGRGAGANIPGLVELWVVTANPDEGTAYGVSWLCCLRHPPTLPGLSNRTIWILPSVQQML